MAPLIDLGQGIIGDISTGDILGFLYLVFTILIFVVGFYYYFKIEKDTKILLIALGFLFFFLAGLDHPLGDLFSNNLINPWPTVMYFLGSLMVLIAVEPLKVFKHIQNK